MKSIGLDKETVLYGSQSESQAIAIGKNRDFMNRLSDKLQTVVDLQTSLIPGGTLLNRKSSKGDIVTDIGLSLASGLLPGAKIIGEGKIGKNFVKISGEYLKKAGFDAHEIKEFWLGKNVGKGEYDLYKANDTGEILILKKGGKGEPIFRGEFIK